MRAGVADVDGVWRHPRDGFDWDQRLALAQAEEAAGPHFHEADLSFYLVDQEAFDRAEIVAVLVLGHPSADVLIRARDGSVGVAQPGELWDLVCILLIGRGLIDCHDQNLLAP